MRTVTDFSKSNSTWWWVFGLLIAVPALILSFQGFRAVRAERIEREQQMRRQQQQVAQLVDGAIITMLASLENELRRGTEGISMGGSEPGLTWSDVPIFSFNRQGVTVFPRERLYFGGFGTRPPVLAGYADWPSTTQQLVERAQAAEVQGRAQEAVTLYRQIGRNEPRLNDWAELGIARVREGNSIHSILESFQDDQTGYAQGLTPTGLPVALLAATEIERMPEPERPPYLPLARRLLDDVHDGKWWLSYDERRFYNSLLRRIIETLEPGEETIEDVGLDEFVVLDQVARQSPPYIRDQVTRAFVPHDRGSFLVVWSPSEEDPDTWIGTALSREDLQSHLDQILTPLLSDQPFETEIRDARDESVWGFVQDDVSVFQSVGSHAVREWEYAFSASTAPGDGGPRLLWYGFIALLIVMLTTGVGMTMRVAHREMELSRLQNDFVAAVSHEFKSPITGVRLLVERLAGGRTRSPEQIESYYRAIDGELSRLERLVSRLLVMQQVQADRKPYHFATASLVDLAQQAVDLQRPHASAKSIQLVLETDSRIPDVLLDEAAMLDALENLVDNAVKYSPPETLVAVSISSQKGGVVVEVRDQGIGVDPKEQGRIFDKFYRAHGADQLDVRGTGLGLALVKAVMEAHHGTVTITSTPGEGSSFALRIPLDHAGAIHGADSNSR